jgi:hypothetical protein
MGYYFHQMYHHVHQVFISSTLVAFTHDSKLMIEKNDLMKNLMQYKNMKNIHDSYDFK